MEKTAIDSSFSCFFPAIVYLSIGVNLCFLWRFYQQRFALRGEFCFGDEGNLGATF
jgi:hypothetical protein